MSKSFVWSVAPLHCVNTVPTVVMKLTLDVATCSLHMGPHPPDMSKKYKYKLELLKNSKSLKPWHWSSQTSSKEGLKDSRQQSVCTPFHLEAEQMRQTTCTARKHKRETETSTTWPQREIRHLIGHIIAALEMSSHIDLKGLQN